MGLVFVFWLFFFAVIFFLRLLEPPFGSFFSSADSTLSLYCAENCSIVDALARPCSNAGFAFS
jgi:hypothetical protein